jgi:hypothetical protein
MKIFNVFLILAFLLFSCNAFAQSTTKIDSVEFGGRKYPVPMGCQTSGNMIKCDNYVVSWFYEPIEDMPRHRKELLEQLIAPKTIDILLLSSEAKGYVTKIDTWTALNIITELNGKCILLNLFLDRAINSTSDLPEFARQFISIRK